MQNWNKQKILKLLLLLGILAAALFVRTWHLEQIPAGLYPDEAVNGTDALNVIKTGQPKLFFEDNQGREGLFINIQALSVLLFGNTIFALLIVPALMGVLTVLGTFFFAREIFKNYYAGAIAAFLVAFSYWAINFSRIGFRANMVPLILVWTFYLMLRGIRTQKYSDFVWAGLIYGLGLHTYIAFRASPLVLVVLLIFLIIAKQDFLKTYWRHTLIFAVCMFITAAPMLYDFFVANPQHYASRTANISILKPEINNGQLLPLMSKTLGLSLAKYFAWGDQNWRHNYPPYPLFNPIVAATFILGFLYSFWQFFLLLWKRLRFQEKNRWLYTHALLLSWLFVLLIPEFLAAEGNPHALRSIGTIPVAIIFATIPFVWLLSKLPRFGQGHKLAATTMLIMALAIAGIWDSVKYFYFFANSPKQHASFEANLVEAAKYLQTLPKDQEIFFVSGNMQRIPNKYLNADMTNITYLAPNEIDKLNPQNPNNFIVLYTNRDWESMYKFELKFPEFSQKVQEIKNPIGDTFYVYRK